MNELFFKEGNLQKVVYTYKPEGRGAPGEVVYDFASGESTVAFRAAEDETGHYARKACSKITQFITERDSLPLKATQAWY
jgi:hypothetical protein